MAAGVVALAVGDDVGDAVACGEAVPAGATAGVAVSAIAAVGVAVGGIASRWSRPGQASQTPVARMSNNPTPASPPIRGRHHAARLR